MSRERRSPAREGLVVQQLGYAATNLGYAVQDLTVVCQYLPEAKGIVSAAVKQRRLSASDARDLVSDLLSEAAKVQKLRERLERVCEGLKAQLPPDETPPDAGEHVGESVPPEPPGCTCGKGIAGICPCEARNG